MKNAWIDKLRSTVVLKITGKNIDRFIHKLIMNKIELLTVVPVNHKEVRITIYKEDQKKVVEQKTIYDVSVVGTHGLLKIKKMIAFHKIFLFFMGIGLLILLLLSMVISKVEVVHTNHEIRDLLYEELSSYGIKKNHFRKSYFKIQKIKKKIVEEHQDKIEWLEIVTIGTKYVVRVEVRKLSLPEKEKELEDVIAKKSAILKRIESKNGVIVKNVNDYVEKGDVVISGNVMLNEELKGVIGAGGTIYGEVWYKVRVTYPYVYYEENLTGKKNTVYTVKFLNKRWELFNRKAYKDKNIKSTSLLWNTVVPISLVKEKQEEKRVIKELYTEDQAVEKAKEEARKKISKGFTAKEHIISEKKLKVTPKDSRIVVDMFFTVYEDITDTKPVEEIPVPEEKEE